MGDLATDRIYQADEEGAVAFVAADRGVIAAAVAGGRVGRFRIDHRCTAADVATDSDRLAVATDDGVVLASSAGSGSGADDQRLTADDYVYDDTGFGPAVAVGFSEGDPVAAGPQGRIARRVDDEWLTLAEVDAPVRAIDGDLVGAADGIYRISVDGVDDVGLDDVRDVAAAGPYAATGGGLYELGNGWIRAREGAFDAVAAAPDGSAHAAGDSFLVRSDGGWQATGADPPDAVAGIGYAGSTYAVTTGGVVLGHPGDGRGSEAWHTRSLGVSGIGGIAIPGGSRW